MDTQPEKVWYFAYGSNMSSAKFTGGRGIEPIDVARVRIPGWALTMEIPGMPYSEPSFSSIAPRRDTDAEKGISFDVIGVAYLITQEQYRRVISSEGGGIAYRDICLVGEPVDEDDRAKVGYQIMLRTLGTAMLRHPPPVPSQRYMNLLIEGGKEARLPSQYQQYLSHVPVYEPPNSSWTKLGALIFISIWGPVMSAMEKLTKESIQSDGNAPTWVILLVRWTVFVIWVVHDYLFAPIFGRGDGIRRDHDYTHNRHYQSLNPR
ncbi:hypothetical protein F4821DRAFT_238415 [Hypoxylon rubiginosum]|uniref:Uncharacterized protein n=1 Tax=Hypoxylon rubiginosum TaxID=110542 RepID=A0ACC0D183_9PEZI|nr:hypothetical protein F4821DRAFT_238415 [Hypoxylon rubiginosum]